MTDRLILSFDPLEPGEWRWKPTIARQHNPFRSTLEETVKMIRDELERIKVVDASIKTAVDRSQYRVNGWPRQDARPGMPGVLLLARKKDGTVLRLKTDRYWDWPANLRGVALTLEALRGVDRWGCADEGEQYGGFGKALPAGDASQATHLTADTAAELLARHSRFRAAEVLAGPTVAELAFREAAKKLHPDAGGDSAQFRRLSEAYELLKGGKA